MWSVCIGMYKLNSTWPWRFSWNVDLSDVGNRNSCSPSKDRYAAYLSTNLPSSPFDCRVKMK